MAPTQSDLIAQAQKAVGAAADVRQAARKVAEQLAAERSANGAAGGAAPASGGG